MLQTIPGVGATAAGASVAELGADMGRFPSAKHLASWAGVCPGNKQSGGKRLSGKTTQGNPWLRGMLGEVAWAAARSKGTYVQALFQRVTRRRGPQQAIVAVAHSLLRDRQPYRDRGPDHFDRRDTARLERQHVRRLEQRGSMVTLTPRQAASLTTPRQRWPAPARGRGCSWTVPRGYFRENWDDQTYAGAIATARSALACRYAAASSVSTAAHRPRNRCRCKPRQRLGVHIPVIPMADGW